MNYHVSDFISRIKNAVLARRKKVLAPYLKINKEIAKVLVKEGFLQDLKEIILEGRKALEVTVRYEKREPVLTDVVVVSKPSLRIYVEAKNIPSIQRKGRSTLVLSTSRGIMTGSQAYKKSIGGEVLFRIW